MSKSKAVEFRELVDTREIADLSAVFDEIWATSPGPAHFGTAMLVALHHGGHYVVGAFSEGEMIGGCVGFFVEPLGEVLHSHIAGVLPGHAGKGIGRASSIISETGASSAASGRSGGPSIHWSHEMPISTFSVSEPNRPNTTRISTVDGRRYKRRRRQRSYARQLGPRRRWISEFYCGRE